MNDINKLNNELKYHEEHAKIPKFFFVGHLIAIAGILITYKGERELWMAILGLVSAGYFGMTWAWDLSLISRIKEEIHFVRML